jgi:hypothetical protein
LARRVGEHAMKEATTDVSDGQPDAKPRAALLFDDWLDPIETGVRKRVRDFIGAMIEEELGGDDRGRSWPICSVAGATLVMVGGELSVTDRAIAGASSWARSARSRSRCRERASSRGTVRPGSGAASRCGPISVERRRRMR